MTTGGTTHKEESGSQARADRIHELLPWYAAGTLSEEEVVTFRDHLPACADCREELAVVEKMRAQIERHGEAFIEEHPPAELLVAAATGELDGEQAVRIHRHIGLCAACARESRWIAGEAVAGSEPERPRSQGVRWAALAAAAAVVGAMILFAPWRGGPGPAVRVATPTFIRPAELAEESGTSVIRLSPAALRVDLIFEVDFSPGSFPVRLELLAADGRLLHVEDGIGRDVLVEGTYLFLDCDRRVCSKGSYVAKVRPAGGVEPEQTFRFEID